MDLKEFSTHYIDKINSINKQYIESLNLAETLKASILYSYTAGGKRIRPLLLLAMVDAFAGDITKGLKTACSLELIHTSSLIHDDLPAMDNDDYRRGKLTNHKVFGEATAILAGDSLLVDGFNLIASDNLISDNIKVKLIAELSRCSGANGMIGGQQLDMEHEDKSIDIEMLKKINLNKTGKLLEFALVAGAIISEQSEEIIAVIRKVSYHIGMAFQIKDDILDKVGNSDLIGKPINSDEKNHKSTYVTLYGLDRAKYEVDKHYEVAINLINGLNMKPNLVLALFNLIVERNN